MATYDFTITGTMQADSEDEARQMLHSRITYGVKGMGDPVYFDETETEFEEIT